MNMGTCKSAIFWNTNQTNLVQQIKTVSLSWNLEPRLSCICRIQLWLELFLLWTRNTCFGKIWSQDSKLFKVNFSTLTNLNMQNSFVMFTFFVFVWKYPFWLTVVLKTEIDQSSWSLVPNLIQICRIHWLC